MKLANLCVALLIAAGSFASATQPDSPHELDRDVFRGARYLKSCDGLLEALSVGKVEEFIVEQATNQKERAQLLLDYDLIFNSFFVDALLKALTDKGISFENALQNFDVLGPKLIEILKSDSESMNQLVQTILPIIIELNAKVNPQSESRVRFERSTRLISAIQSSSSRDEYFELIALAVRAVIASTIDVGFSSREYYHTIRHKALINTLYAPIVAFPIALLSMAGFHQFFSETPPTTILEFLTFGRVATAIATSGLTHFVATNVRQSVLWKRAGYNIREEYADTQARRPRDRHDRQIECNLIEIPPAPRALLGLECLRYARNSIWKESPIDLIYLGHNDLATVQIMFDALKEQLGVDYLPNLIAQAVSTAHAVLEQPADYRRQIALSKAVFQLTSAIKWRADHAKKMADSLLEQIETLKKHVETLRQIPYQHGRTEIEEAQILANEILLHKTHSDLAALSRLNFDRQALDQDLTLLEPVRDRLERNFDPLPIDTLDWKSAAEDTLLNLEILRGQLP